ncbi:MAG: exodeoxyribonuclease VII small subunit [Oscillospiraceae bacterium]|nr:exodeoxyribonuclease VII small subunit [Oscillospiraceae bacterium]
MEKTSSSPEMSFEQIIARIDEIVRFLEKGDAPLDQSLTLFEEGAKLIKTAGKMLDEAEQTVTCLQKGDSGEPMETLFVD